MILEGKLDENRALQRDLYRIAMLVFQYLINVRAQVTVVMLCEAPLASVALVNLAMVVHTSQVFYMPFQLKGPMMFLGFFSFVLESVGDRFPVDAG